MNRLHFYAYLLASTEMRSENGEVEFCVLICECFESMIYKLIIKMIFYVDFAIKTQ